jgi:small-conductance mechanosensitive channel
MGLPRQPFMNSLVETFRWFRRWARQTNTDLDDILVSALQETLANLFAGFFVSIAGHVRVGDYIRLNTGFGEFALVFNVNCYVEEFSDQYFVQHELRKRIFRRLAREGIRIPFSARPLLVQEQGGAKPATS